LLKELSARTDRVALIYDPQNPATAGYISAIKAAEKQFQVRLSEHPVRDAAEIEHAIGAIAKTPNSGLVILPGPVPSIHRATVIALAKKYLLPAVYPFRYWAVAGGLAFYGIDNIELHRQAASYLDRILKGEKPGDLPIQNATMFQLVLNMKTAKLLGIDPPNSLLARTDEVIE
jgi:putative ABC transport system substrate-binding protein